MDQGCGPELANRREAYAATVAATRVSLQGSRSNRLLRLFDYLVERTLSGEAPTEQQIAAEAFGMARPADTGQDANVRVYVHRLRKLLDAVPPDAAGRRLQIPLGDYRVTLVEPTREASELAAIASGGATAPSRFSRPWWRVAAAGLLGLAVLSLGWAWFNRENAPLAQTAAWHDLAESGRPLVIVIGDYYLFAQPAPTSADGQPQLVWDEAVPTAEDLTILQILNPGQASRVKDFGQQFVSGGTIESLSLVRAAIAQLPSLRRKPVKLVAAYQLTPELLGSADVVYVGPFGGLPVLLRDPLAQASGFRFEPGFGGLTDLASRQHYQSDGMVLTDERVPRRDFAYLASFPGPGGNRVMIVAGLGEAGLKQAAQALGDPAQLPSLGSRETASPQGFEILQRVRTIRDLNVGAKPVIMRPLRTSAIWDSPGNVAPYRPLSQNTPAAIGTTPADRH